MAFRLLTVTTTISLYQHISRHVNTYQHGWRLPLLVNGTTLLVQGKAIQSPCVLALRLRINQCLSPAHHNLVDDLKQAFFHVQVVGIPAHLVSHHPW